MTHTYSLSGMTCSSCEAKVKASLLKLPEITKVTATKETDSVTVTMNRLVSLAKLQSVLDTKYQISETQVNTNSEENKSWIGTYKPLLLIFGFITISTLIIQLSSGFFIIMEWMRHFMAGFFLTFSFFKMLDLKGFAQSYLNYDIIAERIPVWGYVYPFVEFLLGLAFLTDFSPWLTNLITFIVMTVSLAGVVKSVFYKRKIQCACLGTVFQLPMSTVTIIEDLLMVVMSGIMLLFL